MHKICSFRCTDDDFEGVSPSRAEETSPAKGERSSCESVSLNSEAARKGSNENGMSVELRHRVPPPFIMQSADESTQAKTNYHGNGAFRQSMIASNGNPEMVQQGMVQHGIGARRQSMIALDGNPTIKQISVPDSRCVIKLASEGSISNNNTRLVVSPESLFVSTQSQGRTNLEIKIRSGYALNHEALTLSPIEENQTEEDTNPVWGAVYYGMLSLTALWCCGARDKITPNGTPPSGLLNEEELGGRTACRKLE